MPLLLTLCGCGSARHVPQGRLLLDKVRVELDDSALTSGIDHTTMVNYVRQQPNHKVLWSTKLQLGIYNMSGRDTTKWYNRWVRRLGEPPVVYDSALTRASEHQLRQALVNKGFLHAEVNARETVDSAHRKVRVDYVLTPGEAYTISNVTTQIADSAIAEVLADESLKLIEAGARLDRDLLEQQREAYTNKLRNNGYFAFAKEFITFTADTTAGSRTVDLTVTVNPPYPDRAGGLNLPTHEEYLVRGVTIVADYDPATDTSLQSIHRQDSTVVRGIKILYGNRRYLRPGILADNCFIDPGLPYSAAAVQRTYEALARLTILKFAQVQFRSIGNIGGIECLDAYILLTPGQSQSLTFELEGTNSEGDLGVAAAVGYSHRNIGRGSEQFTARLRGAYESLSGNLEGLIHNRYMEYSADLGLTFPRFKVPFLSSSFKRRVRASTEVKMSLSYQERPEYTRIIGTAGWLYKWTRKRGRLRYSYTPVDVNYVYLPESTVDFIDQIAPNNPLLRYSYEDHFIMRMGLQLYYTNKQRTEAATQQSEPTVYSVRFNAETAGNLLYAINSIFTHRADVADNPYQVFGIRYSQYVKAEADYSLTHLTGHRTSLAFHVGMGIGYPYGNSRMLPFEKRFYGGGANGVRGWDVRTLGPGCYPGTNSVSDFIHQCGDIRLDLGIEYRAHLFWILEMAAFVDAGNIWTIHNYESQPGGLFQFNRFYKEIAASYGLGLRLDFTYFLIRFDMGMKAHNPAKGAEPWPLIHPKWGRDSSFHFSIGYPF